MRDCFYDDGLFDDGHLGSAYNRGKWHSMLVDHNRDNNIGEPGHWNPAFITISNGGRTGAIADRGGIEFISDEPGARFCGWQCPERNGIGDCQRDIRINPIRSTRECTGSLWGAVDKSCYRVRGQSFGCH